MGTVNIFTCVKLCSQKDGRKCKDKMVGYDLRYEKQQGVTDTGRG